MSQFSDAYRLFFILSIVLTLLFPANSHSIDFNGYVTALREQAENQKPDETGNDDANEEIDPFEFPEVIVEEQYQTQGYVADDSHTATKTDTPLIETPQSISVITKDQIEIQDAETLGEVLRYTPGVQAEPFGFEPRFTFLRFRGFDATTSGLYRDGLQLRNPSFAVSYSLEPYGAERIEFLRGPASVLYGAGSPGGLINYVSKRPLRTSYREIILEAGSHERFQGRFDFTGPIDDDGIFSYRLTGLFRDSDTQVDFIDDDRVFIAPTFTWQPSKDTKLTFLAEFKYDDTGPSQAIPANGSLRSNPNGEIPVDRYTGEPTYDEYERKDYSITYLFEHTFANDIKISQNARYYHNELDDISLFANSVRDDQRTIDRAAFENIGEIDGFVIDSRVEYGLNTWLVEHDFLFGVDYQYIDVDSLQSFGEGPPIDVFDPEYGQAVPSPAVFNDSNTVQKQLGLYVQDQMNLYKKWFLVLGGRYDWADNEVEDKLNDTESSQDDSEFTGRVGILYKSDIGITPYASYTESFLPTIGTNAEGEAFKPETGRQFEAGLKYQPPGRNAYVTVAVFDLLRENVTTPDPSDPTLQVQTGEVRSRGIELEGVASLGFGLDLIAAYTYLDMEITESNVEGEEGERPTQVPDHTASIWADYTHPTGLLRNLGLGAGIRYIGSSFGDLPNTLKTPDVTLVDAVLHYDWKNFRAQLNAKNLFDKEYVSGCFTRGGSDFCTFGQTRTITGSIAYRW